MEERRNGESRWRSNAGRRVQWRRDGRGYLKKSRTVGDKKIQNGRKRVT